MKKKKLVIISHTQHYKNDDGVFLGWGSTVSEVNFLADYWEEVFHVACLHNSKPNLSSLPYTKNNITFVPIPPYGGKKIIDKILIITKIPTIIIQVLRTIRGASEVQLRLPTSMGIFLLPIFSLFISRKFTFWVKYAGNWNQIKPPLSYKLQRYWLKKNWATCKVTINGFWNNQPKHCLSFQNPCLTLGEVANGYNIAKEKVFNNSFIVTFIGRLEPEKGVERIIEALKCIPIEKISMVNFIGDGDKTNFYKKETEFLRNKVAFHGFLEKNAVHQILSKSHFLLLPSNSEGFPKVIAEAICYGTIPVVSNVGSISHYIDETTGFLWDIHSKTNFSDVVTKAFYTDSLTLKEKSKKSQKWANKFTFVNYLKNLGDFVFC